MARIRIILEDDHGHESNGDKERLYDLSGGTKRLESIRKYDLEKGHRSLHRPLHPWESCHAVYGKLAHGSIPSACRSLPGERPLLSLPPLSLWKYALPIVEPFVLHRVSLL